MVTISAVGDVRISRENPETRLRHVAHLLDESDFNFCQNECTYSDRGSATSNGPRGSGPNSLDGYQAFVASGFNVVSMATNHAGDWGADALVDTVQRLRRDGLNPVGAGADIEEARRPVVVEKDGTKIAFLAYCSVAPIAYYANERRPGVAPLRAFAHHQPLEEDQPGTPAEIHTWPVPEDLDAMQQDVRRARAEADLVFVSMHKGIHFIRSLVADYESTVARAALDAGADLIIGHGAHKLKGIEVYKGKVILHSLGNFAFDMNIQKAPDPWWRERVQKAYRLYGSDMGHSGEGALSVIARIQVENREIREVSLLPVVINEHREPEPAPLPSPSGVEVADYVEAITSEAGFATTFDRVGDRMVVKTS